LILLSSVIARSHASSAQDAEVGDAVRGRTVFYQSCAVCHADDKESEQVEKAGPSLVGVFGRRAATGTTFGYTVALRKSGLTWDAPTLSRFLAKPSALVPGTAMPASISDDDDRANLIAYLSTLKTVH
jgi:cytochrome c2